MEILDAQHDLQAMRAMLGHVRLETTQLYAQIRPAELKRAVAFYEAKALDGLGRRGEGTREGVAGVSRVSSGEGRRTAVAGLSRVRLRVSVTSTFSPIHSGCSGLMGMGTRPRHAAWQPLDEL